MLTLYNKDREKEISFDKLLDLVNDSGFYIPDTIKEKDLIKKYVEFKLNGCRPYRVCVESYKTSQKLYTEIWLNDVMPFTSFKIESASNESETYKIKRENGEFEEVTYDVDYKLWFDNNSELAVQYGSDNLRKLRRATIYLETRELYVMLRKILHKYLVVDIIQYILHFMIPDINKLNGTTIK